MKSRSQYHIAVLLPSRGRTTALKTSIESLVTTCSDLSALQILLAFDDDDQIGPGYFVDEIIPFLEKNSVAFTAIEMPRQGYHNLNIYYNHIANLADADWLFCWNDDAIMQTQDWDRVVGQYDGEIKLLRVRTHLQHPYSIFPIWPREWFDLFGHTSRHQMIDAELSQIAYLLDIMQNVEIDVLHDRHDITGNNNDTTHQQKIQFEGNPGDPRDFHHISWAQRRADDCEMLSNLLKSRGVDISFWERVKDGKQDPWEKLIINDVNRLTVQWDNPEEKEAKIKELQSMKITLPDDLLCCLPKQIDDPIRIGCDSDGGYIIPRSLLDHCDDLLSGGLGENWSFDRHWQQIKPNGKIHVYDGTVNVNTLKDYLREPYRQFFGQHATHFQENLLPGQTDLNAALKRLDSQRVLLKMDIEGGEFALLQQILDNRQIIPGMVIEIHFANSHRQNFVAAVNTLREHYTIVHLHGNNHTLLSPDRSCDCYELTMIRNDLCKESNDRYDFYLPDLDRSNVPGLEDWQFRFFEKSPVKQ